MYTFNTLKYEAYSSLHNFTTEFIQTRLTLNDLINYTTQQPIMFPIL